MRSRWRYGRRVRRLAIQGPINQYTAHQTELEPSVTTDSHLCFIQPSRAPMQVKQHNINARYAFGPMPVRRRSLSSNQNNAGGAITVTVTMIGTDEPLRSRMVQRQALSADAAAYPKDKPRPPPNIHDRPPKTR